MGLFYQQNLQNESVKYVSCLHAGVDFRLFVGMLRQTKIYSFCHTHSVKTHLTTHRLSDSFNGTKLECK